MKSKEKLMKSIPVLRSVINCCIFCFVTVFLINIHTSSCQAQTKDTLYILFESDKPNMMIMKEKDDCHYAFWISKYYYLGFQPKGTITNSKCQTIEMEMKDINWIRDLTKSKYSMIMKCPNIFIVERINKDSLKFTPVEVFEAIE
ncbi:MAG: hypothetical protein K0M40_18155 [Prolixibacteraceae bacterium]|nr:hypothetical protein [Prolixibacteraceae bacterium]